MQRLSLRILITVSILAVALFATQALAAPLTQEARPIIAQPKQGAAVRGVVQIVGSATHPQFQRYELYYAVWPVQSDQAWIFIGDAHRSPQTLGLLGTWDSRSVPDGSYALRVRVVKEDGNYIDSEPRQVAVANTRPAESPTPEGGATPEPLPTPADAPTSAAPTAAPTTASAGDAVASPASAPTEAVTQTPEPAATPILATTPTSGATPADASVSGLAGQLFNGQKLLDTAIKAAIYTGGAFVAIGLFFAIKWLLVWLWHKIRP